MAVIYHLAADLVATIHSAYIAFVVFGFIAIILGIAMGWRWVCNMYFRMAHLAAILLVCVEVLLGVSCPLTVLEARLRVLGTDTPYPASFIGSLLDRLIFYDLPQWLFTVAYLSFGALVLLTFVLAPPHIGRSGTCAHEVAH
ncbi:MAG: DUF2784 domain-containing protein [Deltaproteobacteria bacterium]|nr:DUF2784 domain-containing protein [Deltaproteobacteria bacterium]